MTMQEIISAILEGKELSVEGVPFSVGNIEEIKLSTGELMYFAYAESGALLSVDPTNEECYLLESCDEEIDLEEDLQVYNGHDYEFSTESEGRLVVEEELTDGVMMRDYEASSGRVLRAIEYQATGDMYAFEGKTVSEEEIVEST